MLIWFLELPDRLSREFFIYLRSVVYFDLYLADILCPLNYQDLALYWGRISLSGTTLSIYACTYFSYAGGTQLQIVEADTQEQAATIVKAAHAQETNFLMRRVFDVTASLARLPKN